MIEFAERGDDCRWMLSQWFTVPTGVRQLPDVVSKADGLHEMSYQAKVEGQHKINVLYGGRPVPDR